MNHLIANISWNSNLWKALITEDDRKHAGHRYVKERRGDPHEALNFSLTENIADIDGSKVKKGFFQCTHSPKDYSNGEGIIFFSSKNYNDGNNYIVGLYGKATIMPASDDSFNISCPIDFCIGLEDPIILKVDTSRHFGDKKRMGQVGFIKIGDIQANNIIDDLLSVLNKGTDMHSKVENAKTAVFGKTVRYWKIAPGEQAYQWERFRNAKHIAIGWDELDDLRQFGSYNELREEYGKAYPEKSAGTKTYNSKSLWNFRNLSIGDIIIANRGKSKIVGIGKVTGPYRYEKQFADYHHIVPVDWSDTVERTIQEQGGWTHTIQELSEQEYRSLLGASGNSGPTSPSLPSAFKDITAKAKNIILYGPPGTGKTFRTIDLALQIIDGSVPSLRNDAAKRFRELRENGRIEFVTFHQSYSYEEFIEGLKPKSDETDKTKVYYVVEDGVFKRICSRMKTFLREGMEIKADRASYKIRRISSDLIELEPEEAEKGIIPIPVGLVMEMINLIKASRLDIEAIKDKDSEKLKALVSYDRFIYGYRSQIYALLKHFIRSVADVDDRPYVIIIDEINRGNISKIFGELITLIEPDKRIGSENEMTAVLPYSKISFGVPANLHIIGTMNTADRSIALLDVALRRRFKFLELMPDADLLKGRVIEEVNLRDLLEIINRKIELLYDRDHQIGHSYFLKVADVDDLRYTWYYEIIPLLQEYFYCDWSKIKEIIGTGFIEETDGSKSIATEDFDPEKKIYKIKAIEDPKQFMQCIKGIFA